METNLEAIVGVRVTSKLLPNYFEGYLSSCQLHGQYVPKTELMALYPDDVPQCGNAATTPQPNMEPVSWRTDPAQTRVVDTLRKHGIDPAQLEKEGNRPVHWAARIGNAEALALIVDADLAEITKRNTEGMDAVSIAAAEGHQSVLEILLNRGLMLDKSSNFSTLPLGRAAAKGHLAVCKWLLDNRADISLREASGVHPIHQAAKHGHGDVLRLLVKSNAYIGTEDNAAIQPLHLAVERGHQQLVGYLLASNADPDAIEAGGVRALHWASLRGHFEIVQALLNARANVRAADDALQAEPLHWAAESGHEDIVELLVIARAAVNARSGKGTAAALASAKKHTSVLEALVKLGAEIL